MIPAAVESTDLLAFLGLPLDSERYADIPAYADAATAAAEGIVGAIVTREETSRVTVRNGVAAMPRRPVSSVASLSKGGATLTGPYDVDSIAGLVRLESGAIPGGEYTAVYAAGRCADTASVPAGIAMAVKIIAKHLYDVQRGAGRGGVFDESTPSVPTGFAIPARAAQLLAPHRQVGLA